MTQNIQAWACTRKVWAFCAPHTIHRYECNVEFWARTGLSEKFPTLQSYFFFFKLKTCLVFFLMLHWISTEFAYNLFDFILKCKQTVMAAKKKKNQSTLFWLHFVHFLCFSLSYCYKTKLINLYRANIEFNINLIVGLYYLHHVFLVSLHALNNSFCRQTIVTNYYWHSNYPYSQTVRFLPSESGWKSDFCCISCWLFTALTIKWFDKLLRFCLLHSMDLFHCFVIFLLNWFRF